jgi:hypothetical protein
MTTADDRDTAGSRIVTILNYICNGNESALLPVCDIVPSFISRKFNPRKLVIVTQPRCELRYYQNIILSDYKQTSLYISYILLLFEFIHYSDRLQTGRPMFDSVWC